MWNHFTEIKKSVSFVFIKWLDWNLLPNWTWFFLWVQEDNEGSSYKVYFVSAKHVLQDSFWNYYEELYLRINTKDWSSRIIKLLKDQIKIYEHIDKDVDLALFNCLPGQDFDYKFLPNSLIASKDVITKFDIQEWEEVFFTGLFTSHIWQNRNQPIMRFWKVALISEEKIEWKEFWKDPKFMDLYLMECQSFWGNSWSPVFFQLNPMRKPWTIQLWWPNIFLAWIMTWSFMNGNNVQISKPVPNLVSLQNIWISGITPAYKLFEALKSNNLLPLASQTKTTID